MKVGIFNLGKAPKTRYQIIEVNLATHKVVPIEPTPEQHEAGHKALEWYNKMTEKKQVQKRSMWDTIYCAMVGKNK